jgi:hypothetical protein
MLLLAAILFPLDVAARRLRLGRREWQQGQVWLRRFLPGDTQAATEPVLDQSPTLQAFRQARRRVRAGGADAEAETTASPSGQAAQSTSTATFGPSAQPPVSTTSPPQAEPSASNEAAEQADTETDTLSRLRAAKRRAQR